MKNTIARIEPINKPGISVYVDLVREVFIHHRVVFSNGSSRLFMTYVNDKTSCLEAGNHPSVRFFSLTKCGTFIRIFPDSFQEKPPVIWKNILRTLDKLKI